ncbi:MAG: helix-turn-helix domain-containing protein [Clostridiales bacterium]|nr:helix-turn-helix domain-containing protein [Clostridiales bacterium]MDO4349286.1 helix-turn-helix transcriptional regulator [Eubacteriales bacterium]MDY4008667.1 helix-turn-helix transcriptional regulator [Candidatus Limiplasma sp.]
MKIYAFNGKSNLCGETIRRLREKKRLSQEQLAAKMQVEGVQINQKAVSRIETGDRVVPDYEVLVFARVLGVEAGQLLREREGE